MKKIALFLPLVLLLNLLPVHAAQYVDVPAGCWYERYVLELNDKGVVSGYPDGSFRPNASVTYGEALKLILLAAGYPGAEPVDAHWASGYYRMAVQGGYLPDGQAPDLNRPITRLEVAQLAARAMGLFNTLTASPFVDCADPDVLALYEVGILEGIARDGFLYFDGHQSLLRSQVCAIIWRIEAYEPVLTGGILTPGGPSLPPAEQPPVEQPPEETPPVTEDPQPPKTITYKTYTLDVLEDVPVFAYNPASFFLENGRLYCSDPAVRLVHGIDVSGHQGDINWDKVAADGVDFAIIRAAYRGYTVGSLNRDTCFEQNIANASCVGLDVGVYVFSQAITVEEAVQEADFVLQMLAPYQITGPVVFDWEVIGTKDARTYGLDTDTLCDAANAFCQRVAQAGYQPMIYFNSYCGYVKYDLSRILDYPFWFAQYQAQPDFYYHFQMWQYTSSGKVDGIKGNVDLDVWLLPNE